MPRREENAGFDHTPDDAVLSVQGSECHVVEFHVRKGFLEEFYALHE